MSNELILAHHALETALGKERRRNQELLDLLTPALKALDKGYHDVTRERLEVSIDLLLTALTPPHKDL